MAAPRFCLTVRADRWAARQPFRHLLNRRCFEQALSDAYIKGARYERQRLLVEIKRLKAENAALRKSEKARAGQ